MIINTGQLKEISEIEFGDIVDDVILTDINEIRIILIDGSFIDVWLSLKLEGRYSYPGKGNSLMVLYIAMITPLI